MEFRSGPRRRSARLLPLYDGPDLISTLPDDLLLLVLARLPCAAAAARTGVLSRRWHGLWVRLRRIVFNDVAFHSLEAALGRVPLPPPTVSLLQIRLPKPQERVPKKHRADTARFSSLLSAAARLDPEEFFLVVPSRFVGRSLRLKLPCFQRATSIVLDLCSTIRCVPAGAEFPALETLSLSCCDTNFDAFLSCCPRLRTLRITDIWFPEGLRINSPSLQELVVGGASWTYYHVNIVAPMLKQLAMSINLAREANIFVLAPMMEKVLWSCSLIGFSKFGFWRVTKLSLQTSEKQGQLPSLHIHAFIKLSAEKFTHEIETRMISEFSALELHLTTEGHVFGAFVCHLLGVNRIRCAMQRLKINLRPVVKEKGCQPQCPCDSPNWKSQTMSLTYLKEVEFNGFEGEDHELDLLKLILRCAPMLKRIIMKLSQEASANNDRSTKTDNICRVYSSVECYIYLSSGIMWGSWNCPST